MPLGAGETELVRDGGVSVGGVEDRRAQVGGGWVVHLAQGVSVLSLKQGRPTPSCSPGVTHVAVLVHGLGQSHFNGGAINNLKFDISKGQS